MQGIQQSLIQAPYLDILTFFGGLFVLFVLIISALAVLFFLRRHKEKRQHILKIIGIVFVVVLVGGILILMRDTLKDTKRQIISDIPDSAKQVSDDYVISKVGNEYFQKNFVFDNRESAWDAKNSNYYVIYEFLPLRLYVDDFSKRRVRIIVSNGIAQERYYNQIPNCLEDATLCQFNLTQQEFLKLKAQHSFIETIEFLDPPHLKTFVCPGNKIFLINYINKETVFAGTPYEYPYLGLCNLPTH